MESKLYYPNRELFENPRIKNMCEYEELVEEFDKDYEGTWAKFADEKISWFKKYDKILDESEAPFYKWFVGGKLNVAYNCVDRHLRQRRIKLLLSLRVIMAIKEY